jgi:galactokinase
MVSAPSEVERLSRAPGRANLIGEHTDYNDGLVLPVALELETAIVGARRPGRIRLRSEAFAGELDIDPETGAGPTDGWGLHATAVVRAMRSAGHRVAALDGVVVSTVPHGAGLSSSAAFEVALAMALLDDPIPARDLALLCRTAENEHVGVRSGFMDPMVIAAAVRGTALLIDCRSLSAKPVPVPDELRILVIDSGQRRELAVGDYNLRRAECEEAARLLGVASLREVGRTELQSAGLPEPFAARARHVVTENERVVMAVDALIADDRAALGQLFADSHRSLADDFAVSTPELDLLVAIARSTPGVVAARMTGAGFGGCTVNLVEVPRAESAADAISAAYDRRTGRPARAWVSRPAPGALSRS